MSDYSTQALGEKSSQTRQRIRYMTSTAVLSAIAFVLQFFEFSVPIMPVFIKMDLSDLPELIGAFALGPVAGVLIALIKNLIHLPMSQSGGVGEMCNFLLGGCFAFTAGMIYKYHKTKAGAMMASVAAAVAMAVASFPINYFITYPFYENFMPREAIIAAYQVIQPRVETLAQCLLLFNLPFTFVKAAICAAITIVVYKRISPILHG